MGYQNIYNQLRGYGLTEAGALGMMGNWDCESNCESVRLEGDFSKNRSASKEYTEAVNDGRISMVQFRGDKKGYGLAQWTYGPRKENLWTYCRARGKSIGDENTQIAFAIHELQADYSVLLQELKTSNDLYQCTKNICYQFENPAVKNVDARFASAKKIQGEIDTSGGGDVPPEPEPEPQPEPAPTSEFWPPRVICKGMKGRDVEVLCAVLKARGWGVNYVTDEFGSFLEGIVKEFQRSVFPDAPSEWDGIVGPKTWTKLLDRG